MASLLANCSCALRADLTINSNGRREFQEITLNAGLAWLNAMPHEEAAANLLKCCGSANWAERMAESRPFRDEQHLFDTADHLWRQLSEADWLEAFRHHPKIGETPAQESAQSSEKPVPSLQKLDPKPPSATPQADARRWAADEQSATRLAQQQTLEDLARANREYQARFGYIFIVCATGKTAEQMLALLRQRLQNDSDAEIAVAADEQRRITRLRLEKLLQGK